MTPDDFIAKVENEGGVLDALEYGLKSGDLEPVTQADYILQREWLRLEDLWAERIRPTLDAVEAAMDAVDGDG